jgi:hypothetical protein
LFMDIKGVNVPTFLCAMVTDFASKAIGSSIASTPHLLSKTE